jgi:hypothetical protein
MGPSKVPLRGKSWFGAGRPKVSFRGTGLRAQGSSLVTGDVGAGRDQG